MEVDELYMSRALQLARRGAGYVSPNPMVGAVVVCDGRIIGEGWHRRFGGPHAEVNAIASVTATDLLPRSTVYVTLEPCSHYGKTPPCSLLLIEKKIARVVVGCYDPNEKVSGRGVAMLRQAGIEVEVGVLEKECASLNRFFMTAHRLRRPYVLLKWACSSDMYLDSERTAGDPAPKFSTPETLQLMHRIRSEMDMIMVGANTVVNDNPRLDVRLFPGRSPRKAVIDGRGRMNVSAAAVEGAPLFHFSRSPLQCVPNVTPCVIDGTDTLRRVLARLFEEGAISVMVEGGPTLLKSLIDAGLWDEARIEIAPLQLGDRGRAPMFIPAGETSSEKIGSNLILRVKNTVPSR